MADAIRFLTSLRQKLTAFDIDWEARLQTCYLRLLQGQKGLGIVDVGGHAARHSQVFIDQLSPDRLLIIEPLPVQAQQLRERFALSANVSVRECALSMTEGRSIFVVKSGSLEESGLRQRSFYNDGNTSDLMHIEVNVQTLDTIGVDFHVDFMKIDTEGAEIDILRGGEKTIRKSQPIISVEFGPGGYDAYGHTPDTLYTYAQELGYGVFDLFGNRFVSLDEWRACVAKFYWDYLLIPTTKFKTLSGRLASIQEEAHQYYG